MRRWIVENIKPVKEVNWKKIAANARMINWALSVKRFYGRKATVGVTWSDADSSFEIGNMMAWFVGMNVLPYVACIHDLLKRFINFELFEYYCSIKQKS